VVDFKISLAPKGPSNFSIVFTETTSGLVKRTLGEPDGFTEADLRSPTGLTACGLTEAQIDTIIALAQQKR
jgi:hypothetical protein